MGVHKSGLKHGRRKLPQKVQHGAQHTHTHTHTWTVTIGIERVHCDYVLLEHGAVVTSVSTEFLLFLFSELKKI